jgi:hypothetical protein
MVFSYGFIDDSMVDAKAISLSLDIPDDDPLGKAKVLVFAEAPVIHITSSNGDISWRSPFVRLLCINEEDGLGFRVLQSTDGTSQLRAFWHDQDVTEAMQDLQELIANDSRRDLFELRAIVMVEERIDQQLARLREMEPELSHGSMEQGQELLPNARAAWRLHQLEATILAAAIRMLSEQVSGSLLDRVTSKMV